MRGMFYNLNRSKQAKALMLHYRDDKSKRLKEAEYAVLRALAERMAQKTLKPRSKHMTPTIIDTCFPSLKAIARDAAMCESTASRAIDKLEAKGLIQKEVIHNFSWRGRKDYKPKHNGVRYRVTSIWDEVPVVEYGEDHEEAEAAEQEETTAVNAEDMAEVERVLAEDTNLSVGTEAPASATEDQLKVVFGYIQHYFRNHQKTFVDQTEKDAIRSTKKVCKELAKQALALGDLRYATDFIWWMIQRRNAEYVRLSDKVDFLGGPYGLLKSIDELWAEFKPEADDDYGQYGSEDDSGDQASDAPEYVSPTLAYDEDDDFTTPVAKAVTPVYDFEDEDEDDDIHQVKYEAVPAPKPTPKVVPVVAPVMAPPPMKLEYRADLELKALLRKLPTSKTEATFHLPDDCPDELIEYLQTTFGDDCFISDGSVWIAGHRANGFLQEDRFVDPFAKGRKMFDCLVGVVEAQCKQSFAAIVKDFNLSVVTELGITREHYKAWVGDRFSDFVSVSDLSCGSDRVVTKVSLRKGVNLLQFAEHLKNNPFTAPPPPSASKSGPSMLA